MKILAQNGADVRLTVRDAGRTLCNSANRYAGDPALYVTAGKPRKLVIQTHGRMRKIPLSRDAEILVEEVS